MKNLMIIIAAICAMNLAQASILVGRVDIQKIMTSINEGKQVRKKLEKEFKKKEKVLKAAEKKLIKNQKDFKKI